MQISLQVALVGMGVRGTECVLQLAHLADQFDVQHPIHLHLIDPFAAGAGRTWRTDQSPLLLMNNTVNGVTVYASGDDQGLAGPTLWEWVLQLRDGTEQHEKFLSSLDPVLQREVQVLTATDFASRALYGEYLEAALAHGLAVLGDRAVVTQHRAAVTNLRRDEVQGVFDLELSDGTALHVDRVVLSLGWLTSRFDGPAGMTPKHRWITPGHPADQPLNSITAEDTVMIRGLGMSFFDTITLLTQGRGGTFEKVNTGEGETAQGEFAELRYLPSGNEPRVLVGSGRGVPYRSKRTAATAGAQHDSLDALLQQLRGRDVSGSARDAAVDFGAQLWPRIQHDAVVAFYATLARVHPERMGQLDWAETLSMMTPERALAVAGDGVLDARDAFDLAALEFPAAGLTLDDSAALQEWIRAWVNADLHETENSVDSPLKAASRVLGAARPRVAFLLEQGLIAPESMPAFRRFMALGAMLQGGPPAQRAAELLALSSAGVVTFVGAAPQVTAEYRTNEPVFVVTSPTVPTETHQASVLLDAWVHAPEAANTDDELLSDLLDSGLARAHVSRGQRTGAVEVNTETFELVRRDGGNVPGLYSLGIPHEGQRVFTILSPQPEVASPLMAECRAVAESLIAASSRSCATTE